MKAAADVDYPAYGVTGPSKDVSPTGGDRKLAQSAHMYHYQHQKQQMAALQKTTMEGDRQGSAGSDVESEDDNEEGDYTVYECPGLAPVRACVSPAQGVTKVQISETVFMNSQHCKGHMALKTEIMDAIL